jgi:hypothetical protein
MLKDSLSNGNMLVKTFFQGRFGVVPEAILIVVGTWIGAERYDRILAQLMKRVITNLDIEAEIITDTYYNEKIENYEKNPIICIGSGYINYITKKYVDEGDFGLKLRETTAEVFTENKPPIAFIYGGGVKETYEATMEFCKKKLIIFLDKWSSTYTGGKKKIEIPSNIDELLTEIVTTMSSLPSAISKEKPNNQKVSALQNELAKYKFYLVTVLSFITASLAFLASYYSTTDIWIGLGISVAIIFGIPAIYSAHPKKKEE